MSATRSIDEFFPALVGGERDAISALFPGPVAFDTPLSGAVDGRDTLDACLEQEGYWWQEHVRAINAISALEDPHHRVIELLVDLEHEGRSFDLPIALFGQKTAGGYGQIRLYHSTWPLNGAHTYRAPIIWPSTELEEPKIIETYFEAIGRPDKALTLSLFTEEAYVREPSGSAYKHRGAEGRQHFYDAALDLGGVGLTHATATFDGKLFAVEYLCDSWGPLQFEPMAGCAFYELSGDQQRIEAVRIYDDVTPPEE